MKKAWGMKIVGLVFTILGGVYLMLGTTFFFAIQSTPEAGTIMLCVGGGFFALGIVFLGVYAAAKKQRRDVRENGERITASILRVDRLHQYMMKGKTPAVLVCLYRENGVDYIYKSDLIWGEPLFKGDAVSVYIDRAHPKRYYVDVEEIITPTVEL